MIFSESLKQSLLLLDKELSNYPQETFRKEIEKYENNIGPSLQKYLIMNKFVTVWEKYNAKNDEYIFNHIEDGISESEIPQIISTKFGSLQNDWKNYKWRKKYSRIVNNKIIELKD